MHAVALMDDVDWDSMYTVASGVGIARYHQEWHSGTAGTRRYTVDTCIVKNASALWTGWLSSVGSFIHIMSLTRTSTVHVGTVRYIKKVRYSQSVVQSAKHHYHTVLVQAGLLQQIRGGHIDIYGRVREFLREFLSKSGGENLSEEEIQSSKS